MRLIFKTNPIIVINYQAREWCKLPYPDHPRGCPNYNKRITCPPEVPVIENYFDMSKDHYFVVVQFDLASHVTKMKERHPSWSNRQARCVLYWQSTVNKRLREDCQFFTKQRAGLIYNLCPEALGVNVIETCKVLGLPIKTKPVDTIFKIAMLGYPRQERFT